MCGSEGHADLIFEECVGDIVRRVIVQKHQYDTAYHLPDLMIDKALPYHVEN